MKTFILTTAIAMVALFAGSQTANAGGWYGDYGYTGYGYSTSNYGHVHHNVNTWSNPGYGHYDFHNTSHFDYQPARVIRHYDHFDYQPGGYRLHQTGHYDLHH